MFNYTEETFTKFLEKHNTSEENLEKDVEIIRDWFKTQPHLPEVMVDSKIQSFLLFNKCSIEKTKQKIDNYYSMRSIIPELFETSNPKLPNMKKFVECTYFFMHPKRICDLHRCNWTIPKFPNTLMVPELAMFFIDLAEVSMTEDKITADIIWIADMKNITLTDIAKASNPILVAKILTVFVKIYSLCVKAIYFINSPPYISKLVTLLKSIMKPKIFDRIEVHQNEEVLKTLFSVEDLPKEYGGKGLSLDQLNEMTTNLMISYQNRFDQLDYLRVNEKLRPEKLDNDDILGFHGNFKKLTVD